MPIRPRHVSAFARGCTAPAYARHVATQASIEYYLALDRSDRPRTYLLGPSPDD
ncbi:MAG: hypothetical protein J2P27_01190 [Actinobacteria bacterium]|nr:hypothetical protein [Actinomycetota bacterium]